MKISCLSAYVVHFDCHVVWLLWLRFSLFAWKEVNCSGLLKPGVTLCARPSGVTACHAAEHMFILYWFP